MEPMDVNEFIVKCKQFRKSGGDFSAIVNGALSNLPVNQKDLANKFHVTPSSICRWASGKVTPSATVQKVVLSDCMRRAKRFAKALSPEFTLREKQDNRND